MENLYINALGSDEIDLSCIETITGYLEVENSIAPSIDLSGCTSIGDELNIHDNDDLESIDLVPCKPLIPMSISTPTTHWKALD